MSFEKHAQFLARSAQLALKGRGAVTPNPLVGAVVVYGGRVVAEGYHRHYGARHAEADALDTAGHTARGATLYCNLEPCSYTAPEKHQPPCTRRIIDAGIEHVVIGQLDPNPRVRGDGVRQLEDAGITVTVAADGADYLRLNDAFNTWMTFGRPLVHLKAAVSLDGRIAAAGGDSKWITGEESRREAHRLRAQRDAIAVGIDTVLTDDPRLTTRLTDGQNPRPIVFDSRLRIPLDSYLVRSRSEELVVFHGEDHFDVERAASLKRVGVTLHALPRRNDGTIDLPSALAVLGTMGITSLLVEGGATLLSSFIRHELFDRLTLFIAPIVIGSGPSVVDGSGISRITDALRLDGVTWRTIGSDQIVDGYHPDWLASVTAATFQEEHSVYGTH